MKIKFSKNQLYTLLICIGLFITGTTLRTGLYQNTVLQRFSPLVYIGLVAIFFLKLENKDLFNSKVTKFDLLNVLIIYTIIFFELLLYDSLYSKASLTISLVLPIIILSFQFVEKNAFKQTFNLFYIFLKITACIIAICGLVDIITNFSITKFIADFTNVQSYFRIIKQNRLVSYMGHPLFTSEILLVFYIFSHYYSLINNKKEKIFDFAIALIGILLCQSRTAILLLFVLFLVYNFNIKKVRYLMIFFILLLVIYYKGGFDGILSRFQQFKNGDIRTQSFNLLISQEKLRFFLFKVQDVEIISEGSLYAAALEYPIYRWSYLLGIIPSLILAFYIFLIPLIKVLKDRQVFLVISMLILMLDVNTFSALGDTGMKQTFYYIIVCLLINLSKYLKEEKNDNKNFK